MIGITVINARIVRPPACDGRRRTSRRRILSLRRKCPAKLQPAEAHASLPSRTVSAVTICRTVQRARGQAADTITPRRRKPTLRERLRTDIPHIRLRVSKEPAILHDGYCRGIHERRQLSHRAHKTISRCRELASARQRRRLSARLHTLQLIQAHSSPPRVPESLAPPALHLADVLGLEDQVADIQHSIVVQVASTNILGLGESRSKCMLESGCHSEHAWV